MLTRKTNGVANGPRLSKALAVCVLAHRGALGAMGPQIEGTVQTGLLPDPNPVLNLGYNGAANRAMRTDGFDCLDLTGPGLCGLGLADHSRGHGRKRRGTTCREPGPSQERPTIDRIADDSRQRLGQTGAIRHPIRLLGKH